MKMENIKNNKNSNNKTDICCPKFNPEPWDKKHSNGKIKNS